MTPLWAGSGLFCSGALLQLLWWYWKNFHPWPSPPTSSTLSLFLSYRWLRSLLVPAGERVLLQLQFFSCSERWYILHVWFLRLEPSFWKIKALFSLLTEERWLLILYLGYRFLKVCFRAQKAMNFFCCSFWFFPAQRAIYRESHWLYGCLVVMTEQCLQKEGLEVNGVGIFFFTFFLLF